MNNELLYNAAIAGFIAGSMSGRSPSSEVSADYTNLVDAAEAFATQLDGVIANDVLISAPTGEALEPTTDDIQQDQLGRVTLLTAIVQAITSGRYYTSETAADYANLADVCAAQYAAGIAALQTVA